MFTYRNINLLSNICICKNMQIYIYFMMKKEKYVAKYGNLSISPFSTKK